jgi:hypothetical protein
VSTRKPIIRPGLFARNSGAKNFTRILHELCRSADIFPTQTAFEKMFFESIPFPRRHFTEQVALNGQVLDSLLMFHISSGQ